MADRGRPKARAKASRGARKGVRRRAAAPPVLGNDPFERGAAERAPVQPAAAATAGAPPGPVEAPVERPSESHPEARGPAAEPVLSPAPPPASPTPAPLPVAAIESARARLDEIESRVESAAASAASRLRELARQEASGEHARDLVRAVTGMLPAVRERLSALADLGAAFAGHGPLDAHGMAPDLARRVAPLLEFLYASWWRVRVHAIGNVPPTGPVVVVANHGGVLPWDALVLRLALQRDHPAHRDLRPLLDEHALAMPIAGQAARRLGAVAATPDAAVQLLEAGAVVAVFPEGSRASTRPWPDRYRIQRFGRGGFVKLALRTGASIVPCAIVGSEETAVPVARAGWLSSALGMPFLRSPPSRPLATLGAVPLPARWSLRFGAPIDTAGAGPAAAGDAARVADLADRTRRSLQQILDDEVGRRRSVFL